jgi:hypothetical protein
VIQYIYRVAVTARGQEALWRQSHGLEHWSGQRDAANSDSSVGRWELIEAHHIEEAVQTARSRFPDLTVMREGSERLCRA